MDLFLAVKKCIICHTGFKHWVMEIIFSNSAQNLSLVILTFNTV